VFAAWADRAAKARWFGGPDDGNTEYELDFRVGGRELNRGGPPEGPVYTYEAVYRDIAPNERIVYTYEMYMGDARNLGVGDVRGARGRGRRHTADLHGARCLPRRARLSGAA